jgi:stearoyl-CoA desaturase (Delta-9 desaturase)
MPSSEAKQSRMPFSASMLVYILIHLGALGIFMVPGSLTTGLAVLAVTYWLRIFGLAAYHRLFAHRSYETSRQMQFVLALLGMTALQKGPLWWAETHRRHHRLADTPDDIHSPSYQGFWYSHWGWFFDPRYKHTQLEGVKDLAKYPELVWLDGAWPCRLVFLSYGAALWFSFGWLGLAWGFCLSTVLEWHTVHWVQSMSHYAGGYRNFDTADRSRNHWWLGVVSLGEFHNNHHHRPGSARLGYQWWEIDVTYLCLRVLARLGLVWNVKDMLGTPRATVAPEMTAVSDPREP